MGDGNFTSLYPLILIFNCYEDGFIFLKLTSASIIPKSESEHTVHLYMNFSMAIYLQYMTLKEQTSKSFLIADLSWVEHRLIATGLCN